MFRFRRKKREPEDLEEPHDKERVLVAVIPSRFYYALFYLGALSLLILTYVMYSNQMERYYLAMLLALLLVLFVELKRKTSKYIFTESSVILKSGILRRSRMRVSFAEVVNTVLEHGGFSRLFRTGDLYLQLSEGGDLIGLKGLSDPSGVQEFINERTIHVSQATRGYDEY